MPMLTPTAGGAVLFTASDANYFPLAKGLILSLLESGALRGDKLQIAFIDLGCDPASLTWLTARGVHVIALDSLGMGELSMPHFGYHRAQTCRPFLPNVILGDTTVLWVDCDAWFQNARLVNELASLCDANPARVFAAPELHYTYPVGNELATYVRQTQRTINEELFGAEIADRMLAHPVINSGFFAMRAISEFWSQWRNELIDVLCHRNTGLSGDAMHFAEQACFNKAGYEAGVFSLIDPLCNYLCLWNPPARDAEGSVVTSGFPAMPLGLVHLAGGWRKFGRLYLERDLLFDRGQYLSVAESSHLRSFTGDERTG